jgi:hypothetical protein
LAATLLASAAALSQAPAGAPAGATGICKDGSYTTTANKKGACRGHKGVQDWYAAAGATTASAPAPAAADSKKKHSSKSAAAEVASAPAAASASTGAPPAGANGQCKDGTYSTAASKKGACRGHQGVKEWYASTETASPAAPAASSRKANAAAAAPVAAAPAAPPAAARAAAAPAAAAAAAPAAVPAKPSYTPAATAAAGGGRGLVWANKGTKVYHCQGDRWYGKTKEGAYMREADAKAQGFRADRGKACQD